MFKVKVFVNDNTYEYMVQENQNLLQLLRKSGIMVESPCNGNGTCGKCKVKIDNVYTLSCNYFIQSDIEVYIDSLNNSAKIVTEGNQRSLDITPIVAKSNLNIDKPDLSNQIADYERVLGESNLGNAPLSLIRSIPFALREKDFNVTLVTSGSDIISVEAGDTTGALYGVAIDIGTTTIAAYLVDLSSGKRVCVNSLLNPQKIYGADVISRIKHTMDNEAGLDELNKLIIDIINICISTLCMQARIEVKSIYAVTIVGNTTMLHLILKVPPRNIASAPFIPAFTSAVTVQAENLGITINHSGIVCVLPSVSAYIGADTVAAVLSTGMAQQRSISLLIDIGTNGEIVLGNENALYSCSSAAGPAFEGANIRNGMGSVMGAVSRISLEQGISVSTIGDAKPIGICGTGIVDAVAQMLRVGIIDETGRIDMEWEPTLPEQTELATRLANVDGINAFVLYNSSETATGREIAITQKDIREIQNAKAAIAAGIHVLVKQAGISFDDIENVYLAGGFGSYIDIENALGIGLIPMKLKGKIVTVGNAAGQGAIEALINSGCMALAKEIGKKMKYIELSSSKDFNDLYIDCMMFENR